MKLIEHVKIKPNIKVKQYNDNIYKLVNIIQPNKSKREEYRRDINEEKLDNSMARSRSKVFEYAVCNKFDYFVTLTLNKEKYDRKDLATYIKDLGQFIRNYRNKHNVDIQYLLIPEKHKDGSWHMHGLIKGIPKEHLVKNEHGYLDWLPYREKFGYISIDNVKNQEAVSKYITKYISKALKRDLRGQKEKKVYYNTRGLKTAQTIIEGYLQATKLNQITFDFENDYIRLKDMNYTQFYAFIQSYLIYIQSTTNE